MTHITASSETLMHQAPWTALDYMRNAVADIDGLFGDGFAREHPELVGSYMLTCTIDFHAGVVARAIEGVATQIEDVADQLNQLPTALESLKNDPEEDA